MPYTEQDVLNEVSAITQAPGWQQPAKRGEFVRDVAVKTRGGIEPDFHSAVIGKLWEQVDDRNWAQQSADFVGTAVGEILKSGPAWGGAAVFATMDAANVTNTGSGTRLAEGGKTLMDATGQRLKQAMPGESEQAKRDTMLEALRGDLATGALPPEFDNWLAGEYDNTDIPAEVKPVVDGLVSGYARQAVLADHGEVTPEKLRAWQETDRNPGRSSSDIPGLLGPRELLADYAATKDPASWAAFKSLVTETDAQHQARLRTYAATRESAATLQSMPEGIGKELATRSMEMQKSPIDLVSGFLPMLRGAKALNAARKGGMAAAVGKVAAGAGWEGLQEGATEMLSDPRATAGQIGEAAAMGALGSGLLEGSMAGIGQGIRRVTVGPQTAAAANGSNPSTPPPDAATGGNKLAQIAARGGRVDAPLEADPSAPVPDAGTGAISEAAPLQTQPRSAPPAAYPSVFDMPPSVPTNPDTAAPPAVQPAPIAAAGSLPASVSAAAPGATLPSANAPTPAVVTRLPTGQDQVSAPVETGLPAAPKPDAAPVVTSASLVRDTIFLEFDALENKPSRENLQAAFPGAMIEEMRPDIISGTQGNVQYRIIALNDKGNMSSQTAKELYHKAFGTEAAIRGKTRFQQMGGLSERFQIGQKIAGIDDPFATLGQSSRPAAESAPQLDSRVEGAHNPLYDSYPPADANPEFYDAAGHKVRMDVEATAGRLSAFSAAVTWRDPGTARGPAGEESPTLAVRYDSNGSLTLEVRTDIQRLLWDETRGHPGRFAARLESLLQEEVIHTAQLSALRARWLKAGQQPANFKTFVKWQAELMMADVKKAARSGNQQDLQGIKRAFHASYVTYHKPDYKGNVDQLWQEMNTNPVFFEHETQGETRFVMEFARQVIQMRKSGIVSEVASRNVLTTLKRWMSDMLNALKNAYTLATQGKLGDMMRDFIGETEDLLNGDATAQPFAPTRAADGNGETLNAAALNPFHGGGLPNWLKTRLNVPANAPFRVQNLGLRAMLKGSALPSELLPFARQSERDIAAIRQTSAQIGQDLNESLTAYAARSGKTLDEVHELAAKAMEDPVILQALPDPVMKERVRRARNLLDDLSAAVGKFAGGDLGTAILKNRGHWMRRSYACFDEASNWTFDNLTKAAGKGEKINGVQASKVLKDARDYVTQNVTAQRAAAKEPAPKPGEIEAIMRQLTDRNVWEKSLLGNMQGSGVSKDVTSLMHRAAYHPDVAAWMKRNGIKDWDYQTVASLAATGGNWQGRNAAVTLAAARTNLAAMHPKATAAEINDMLRQQDIAAPLRALMGEEVNPVKRFLSSSSFQAQYIARHEQQVAMRDLGLQMGLFSMQQTGVYTEELGDGRERNGFQVEVPQKTPNGQTVMVRKAIYATPETMAALRMSQGSANPADLGGRLVEALKFIGSEAKLNKVALNPDSWMVNALGNFMGLIQSGDLLSLQGWSNVARAIELHRSGKSKSGDAVDAAAEAIQDKRRELLARLTAAGVANSGLEMSDVEAALDNRVTQFINEHDAWNTVTGGVRGAILGNGLGRPFGWAGQAVGAAVGGVAGAKLGSETIQKAQRKVAEWTTGNPDRFAKLAAFYSNYEAHLAAGMAEADAFALATEKTMNTLPDYSKLPDLMRQLSRLGLMGSFIGFQYEVYRNAYWNARYSVAEIKSGNPALVARGARRMIGLSSMMTLAAFGLSGMIRGMFGAGVDDEKDKAYRRALGAEHERFGTLAYTKLDEDGASFFNTSYLLPQVTLFEVIKAGIEGRDLGESLSNTAKQLTDQFVSGSVHLDPLIAAWTNQRPIGGKVTYEEGPRGMADRVLYFLYVTMEPGALNKEDRIVRALQERGRYGRQFSLDEELKRFLGVRQNTYTHEERIKSRLFRFRDSYDDARSLARTAYRQGDPNALDTLARANERIGKLQGEWEQFQDDLQTIGLPTNKFEQIRKAVGTAREFPLLIMGESGPESERVKTPKAYRADVEATEDNKARGQVKTR